MISTTVKNLMLNALNNYGANVAAHTDFPDTDGSENEVSGGSPAYARKTYTWATASGGAKAASSTPTLDLPADTTVKWLSYRIIDLVSETQTFAAIVPTGGSPQRYQADTSNNLIMCADHGFEDGDLVAFWGGTIPGGLTEGQEYYVVFSDTDAFQVSETEGGYEIELTSAQDGDTFVSIMEPEEAESQSTMDVTPIVFNLNT